MTNILTTLQHLRNCLGGWEFGGGRGCGDGEGAGADGCDEDQNVGEEDEREGEGREGREFGGHGLNDFEREDGGDEAAGDQQAGEFALAGGGSAPCDAAARYGNDARKKKYGEDAEAGQKLFSQSAEFDHGAEEDEEETSDEEGQLGVEGVDEVALAGREDFEAELLRGVLRVEQAGEGCAEDHDGEEVAAAERVGDRVDDQHSGEGEDLPELLVGDVRQQANPEESCYDCDHKGRGGT